MTALYRCFQCGKNMVYKVAALDICPDCLTRNIQAEVDSKAHEVRKLLEALEKARLEDALGKAKEEKSQWVANAHKSERELQAVIDSLRKKLERAERHKKIQLMVIRGRKEQNLRLNKALDLAEGRLKKLRIALGSPDAYHLALGHWYKTKNINREEGIEPVSVREMLFNWIRDQVWEPTSKPDEEKK